ncbi:MAG: class I SAM-dependent methyltransferase [Cyclobacteriaceae bacterium]
MKRNNFDSISGVYDLLAKLIFGNSIRESQKLFFPNIPNDSRILILGGGTGWILLELFKVQPKCSVWYVDASLKMISLAKRKTKNDRRIQFIHGTEENIPDMKFDVVITNFFLDLFEDHSIADLIRKIKNSLNVRALWIATDFVNRRWWHRLMVRIMYLFFRVVSEIEAKQLPKWSENISESGLQEIKSRSFFRGFIETKLFQL